MESKWSPAWVAVLIAVVLFAAGLYFGLGVLLRSGIGMDGLAVKQTREARLALAKAKTDSERCYPLATIAKDDFNRGKIVEAREPRPSTASAPT